MQLLNEFVVPAPPSEAWNVLTDVARVAACLPGAELTGEDEGGHVGTVKVKVGPITAQYRGVARFVIQDKETGRIALEASGRDVRGQGNATASVVAQLTPHAAGTRVAVTTDLNISGKVAQFGRGVLGDVSAKLVEQFADALKADLSRVPAGIGSHPAEGASRTPPASATSPRPPAASSSSTSSYVVGRTDAVDLLTLTGQSQRARMIAVAVVAAVAAVSVALTAAVLGRRRR